MPNWRLPAGVTRGTWDYIRSDHIADDYDDYFASSELMRLDIEVLKRFLPPINARDIAVTRGTSSQTNPRIADLGCGTGRVASELIPLGYRMLNIDLSEAMLRKAKTKLAADFPSQCGVPDQCDFLCTNLVELDGANLRDVDMAVCLFSSIGMIRGRANRRRFLSSVVKLLNPGGTLILHVHNRYSSLLDPGGCNWLAKTRIKSFVDKNWEYGDRIYAYRGLPSMFLHIYSRREVLADLRDAGFSNLQLLPISVRGDALLSRSRFSARFFAGGYFAIATK